MAFHTISCTGSPPPPPRNPFPPAPRPFSALLPPLAPYIHHWSVKLTPFPLSTFASGVPGPTTTAMFFALLLLKSAHETKDFNT